jgi:hypothetical protein
VIEAYEKRHDGSLSDDEWFEIFSAAGAPNLPELLTADPVTAARRSSAWSYGMRIGITPPGLPRAYITNIRVTLHDIFGNPFRPVTLDPSWLTSDVVALARGIYDERAFDRMPILADALQDAGCDSEDVLNHCRDEKGTHVRGCWVVDLLLGKS